MDDNYVLNAPSVSHSHTDEPLKTEYYQTIDIIIAEMERWFSDNEELLASVSSLDELDVKKLSALQ